MGLRAYSTHTHTPRVHNGIVTRIKLTLGRESRQDAKVAPRTISSVKTPRFHASILSASLVVCCICPETLNENFNNNNYCKHTHNNMKQQV